MKSENTKESFALSLKMICDWRKDLIKQNKEFVEAFSTELETIDNEYTDLNEMISYIEGQLKDITEIIVVQEMDKTRTKLDQIISDVRKEWKLQSDEAIKLLKAFLRNSHVLHDPEISTEIENVKELIDDMTDTISMANQIKILESLNYLNSVIARFQWLTLHFVQDSSDILSKLDDQIDTQIDVLGCFDIELPDDEEE